MGEKAIAWLLVFLLLPLGCADKGAQDDDDTALDDDASDDDDVGDDDSPGEPQLPGPDDETTVTLEGGGGAVDVDTAVYTGRIVLPGEAGEDVESLVVWSALGGEIHPTAGGIFTIRMNQSAMGAITATDSTGVPMGMSLFAAHPDLADVNPEISPATTARSLVYLMLTPPVDDPRLQAMIWAAIGNLQATAALEDAIEVGLTWDATYLAEPSEDCGTHLMEALDEFEELMETAAAHRDSDFLECGADFLGEYLVHETDDRADCVTVTADVDGQAFTASLTLDNIYPRWVWVYLDETGAEDFDTFCDDPEDTCEVVEVMAAATTQMPDVTGVLSALIVALTQEGYDWIRNIFGAEDDEHVEAIAEELWEAVSEASYATVTREVTISGMAPYAGGSLSTSSAGPYQETNGEQRYLGPSFLTVFWILVRPIVALWADLEADSVVNMDGFAPNQLAGLLDDFAFWFENALTVGESCSEAEATTECLNSVVELSIDALALPITSVFLQQRAVFDVDFLDPTLAGLTRFQQLLSRALAVANAADAVVALVNVGIGVYLLNDMARNGERQDTYRFTLDETAPGAPGVAIEPPNPSPDDSLECVITEDAIDPDGDPVTYDYAWLVDAAPSGVQGDGVSSALTHEGEIWTCGVTANDGQLSGPMGYESVTIGPGEPDYLTLELSFQASGQASGGPATVFYDLVFVDLNWDEVCRVEFEFVADYTFGFAQGDDFWPYIDEVVTFTSGGEVADDCPTWASVLDTADPVADWRWGIMPGHPLAFVSCDLVGLVPSLADEFLGDDVMFGVSADGTFGSYCDDVGPVAAADRSTGPIEGLWLLPTPELVIGGAEFGYFVPDDQTQVEGWAMMGLLMADAGNGNEPMEGLDGDYVGIQLWGWGYSHLFP